ncbi:hypothetical protein SAMN05421821_102136 [Mucilaginibacter lappiensis]|uniref:Uncharacterized protein n=1 Tax=Mucilaginibacter lappiensis TaxID=354630 RepID=A0ABR6PHA7_9SPHI|nr:hypothetical protein [Mucilaginibacter lappiensis]SIQ30267.1 hypothetical protein SAMN05421821_102136 [Mucilaginibacter lappiensis]
MRHLQNHNLIISNMDTIYNVFQHIPIFSKADAIMAHNSPIFVNSFYFG